MKKLISDPKFWLTIILGLALALRLTYLEQFPPALYSDEVSQGYNAYSILKTGRDEVGTFLPISIRSFGDWKPPVPTYLMIPTIWVFGLNAYGIRLPSALLGVASVLFMYLIVLELCRYFQTGKNTFLSKNSQLIALVGALFLTLSPWHIMQSRSAMLVSVELFWVLVAVWAFFKAFRSSGFYLLISSVAWVAAFYSYYAMRLIMPLFLVLLFVLTKKTLLGRFRGWYITSLLVATILLLPLGWEFFHQPDVVFGRAKTVSIFYDQGIRLRVWEAIASDQGAYPPIITQLFHNKTYQYGADIIRRFLQHFDGRFLFLTGDKQLPFQIPGMGILYLVDGFFIVIGSCYALKRQRKLFSLLIGWIIISVLPASLTFVTPAQNRTFTMVVPLLIFSATGFTYLLKHMPRNFGKIAGVLLLCGYVAQVIYFGSMYTDQLPRQHADWWHYGFKKLFTYLQPFENPHTPIVISAKVSMPYIFYLYYRQIDPSVAQKELYRVNTSDEFGFEHVARFGNYQFPRDYSWQSFGEKLSPGTILVLTPVETVGEAAKKMETITYPNGQPAFIVYKIKTI